MVNKDEGYVDNKEFHVLLCKNKEMVMDYFIDDINELNLSEDDVIRKKKINKKLMILFRSDKNELYKNPKYKNIQNKLGKIFLRICRGVLTKPNFINYTWDRKDDMISEATFHMSRYVLLFDTELGNPFAYFTTVCGRAFLQCINKQKKYTDKFQPLIYIENFHKENNRTLEET